MFSQFTSGNISKYGLSNKESLAQKGLNKRKSRTILRKHRIRSTFIFDLYDDEAVLYAEKREVASPRSIPDLLLLDSYGK